MIPTEQLKEIRQIRNDQHGREQHNQRQNPALIAVVKGLAAHFSIRLIHFRIANRLPRQQIAKMVGASREMVSRVMKGLEAEGYIFPLDEGRILLREKLSLYL